MPHHVKTATAPAGDDRRTRDLSRVHRLAPARRAGCVRRPRADLERHRDRKRAPAPSYALKKGYGLESQARSQKKAFFSRTIAALGRSRTASGVREQK
jgi:hypothetical protein